MSLVFKKKMQTKKILVVDDEKDVLLVLEKSLTAEGYSVITAENGNDGLTSATTQHPDLIILDVALPDMLGGEVAVKLKEDPRTKNIPIVFLSAMFTSTEESQRGHVVDGNVMFAKPYDVEKLLAALRNLLGEEEKHPLQHAGRPDRRKKIMIVDADGRKKKIMIVDDEEDFLRTTGLQLRHSGYDVVFATDGSSAISVALAENPDLILLDIGLPAGDGFYVMQRITSNTKTGITPIIVITGRDAPEHREHALQAGARAFFQKPFEMDELLKVIQDTLEELIASSDTSESTWKNE